MNTNLTIPKKKYIIIYSLIGALLTTVIPIMVSVDHFIEGNYLLRLIDIIVLFSLVTIVFYFSFWFNIKYYRFSKIKLLLFNFVICLLVSIICISIHYPIWKNTTQIPIIFYIRDEVVRNITIFIVSYLATKFYIKNFENQEIKNSFYEL